MLDIFGLMMTQKTLNLMCYDCRGCMWEEIRRL
jgi:hypothetical protein